MRQEKDVLISKTFVFENEMTLTYENIDILLREDLEQINIREIIQIFTHKNAIVLPLAFKIFNPQINHFITFDPSQPLSKSFVYCPVIMIKYQFLPHSPDQQSILPYKPSNESKRERNKQRSIREVLQCVKQWRQIYNGVGKDNNKVNLQDAAKIVGISKKSLDDYFCQLRLAEEYGFNFESNMEQKIGVMRSYVKKYRGKAELNLKQQKLPKKLRVLQQMPQQMLGDDSREYGDKLQQIQKNKQQQLQSEVKVERYEGLFLGSGEMGVENSYQNKLYSQFNLQEVDLSNPFIIMNRKYSNRQLDMDSE